MNPKKKIEQIELKSLNNSQMYLFGSSVYSKKFNDIDIALIYDKNINPIEDVIKYRKYIRKKIGKELNFPCNILALSTEEEKEMKFLDNAKHIRVK